MKTIPRIDRYMTAMPETINKDVGIDLAYKKMKEFNCRHLPVLVAGELVGLISDRDIILAGTFKGSDDIKVEDVMTLSPVTVTPQTSLDDVITIMAEHKYGSVVIQQENGKTVGIFTAIDALFVLHELLNKNYKPTPEYI